MNFFTPKNIDFSSQVEKAKFLMAYRLSFLFSLVFIVMTIAHINIDFYAFICYLIALLISSGTLIYLLITRKYKHLFIFYAITGTILTHFAINVSVTTPHYVDFLWMLFASFMAFVGVGRKWGLTILSFNAIASFYYIFYSHNIHIQYLKPFTISDAIINYLELFLAFLAIAYLLYQFIAFQDYSEAKLRRVNIDLERQNSLIINQNRDNTTLIKEIHHRVKNNLQIIISLLRLQQSDIKNEESKEHFSEAINRIMVMSTIHQRLYQEKEISTINLSSYIVDLSEDLKKIYQDGHDINVKILCKYSDIDLKTVVPIGLLLNELMSNSYKYAFENKPKGEISVTIEEEGEMFNLIYADNGKWKEKNPENTGFGLELIQILSEQLNGTYEFTTDETGTSYKFKLSKLS